MTWRHRAFGECLVAVATSLVLISNAPLALAQTASAEAQVETRRIEAKRQFESGVEHYRSGQYAEAVSAFLQADKLAPSPALSFNIARAYERLDDTSGALRWYRDYLRRSPDAKNAAEVQARIAALSAKLAQSGVQQLTVLSTPTGASVLVDGRAMGITPLTAELTPGKHRVLLDLAGYRDASSEVLLAPSLPGELSLSLEAEPRAREAAATGTTRREAVPQIDDRASQRRFGVLPWLVAGSGVMGLGGALVFELQRRADEREARAALSQLAFQEKLDEAQRDQTRARVLAGVGGGLLVTGSLLLVFNDRSKSPTRVGLGCSPTGCSASANGSF